MCIYITYIHIHIHIHVHISVVRGRPLPARGELDQRALPAGVDTTKTGS